MCPGYKKALPGEAAAQHPDACRCSLPGLAEFGAVYSHGPWQDTSILQPGHNRVKAAIHYGSPPQPLLFRMTAQIILKIEAAVA